VERSENVKGKKGGKARFFASPEKEAIDLSNRLGTVPKWSRYLKKQHWHMMTRQVLFMVVSE